jgi:hypothetical protein
MSWLFVAKALKESAYIVLQVVCAIAVLVISMVDVWRDK